jgi:hypothetical protein
MIHRLSQLLAILLVTLGLIGSGGVSHTAATLTDTAHVSADHHTGADEPDCLDVSASQPAQGEHAGHAEAPCCVATCAAAEFHGPASIPTSYRMMLALRHVIPPDTGAPSFGGLPLRRPPRV